MMIPDSGLLFLGHPVLFSLSIGVSRRRVTGVGLDPLRNMTRGSCPCRRTTNLLAKQVLYIRWIKMNNEYVNLPGGLILTPYSWTDDKGDPMKMESGQRTEKNTRRKKKKERVRLRNCSLTCHSFSPTSIK